jgi:hypothetical protein
VDELPAAIASLNFLILFPDPVNPADPVILSKMV